MDADLALALALHQEEEALVRPGQNAGEVHLSADLLPRERADVQSRQPSQREQQLRQHHLRVPGPNNRSLAELQSRLQGTNRNFTPEDYEMLMELDSFSEPSSASQESQAIVLSQLPVGVVPASAVGIQCSICLEDMVAGEEVATLPCLHIFHDGCVRKWLSTPGASPMCPIDQMKIDFSSSSSSHGY